MKSQFFILTKLVSPPNVADLSLFCEIVEKGMKSSVKNEPIRCEAEC